MDNYYHIEGETDPQTGCLCHFLGTIILLIILAVCFMLSGCRTQREVIVDKQTVHDTLYRVNFIHDSIFRTDSVFVNQYQRGDTVFRDRDRCHVEYRERVVHDTLREVYADTVYYYDKGERVTVEKPMSRWQRYRMNIGTFIVLLFVGWLVYSVISLIIRLRKK